MMLCPYAQVDGAWSVSDTHIRDLWARLEQCGVARATFRNGEVRSADEFLMMLKHPSNIPVLVIDDGALIGLAWLNGIQRLYAYAHFTFAREAWGVCVDHGKAILEYWFSLKLDGEPALEVLIGNIPECNRHALKYVERLGLKRLGVIPRISAGNGMVIHYLERDDG
jgi:hypothetical protein